MQISYEESLRLKGVAILMMVWLHCFINWNNLEYTYDSFIYVMGKPLVYRVTYLAMTVVPLYCFLSGYGLSKKYPYAKGYIKNKLRSLYLQHWLVLGSFLILDYIINGNILDGSWHFFLGNFIGYNTTYNDTLWFLLPYVMLLCTSPLLFKCLDHNKTVHLLLLISICLLIVASFFLKRQAQNGWEINVFIVLILNYCKLLFPFLLGYVASRFTLPYKYKELFLIRRKYVIISIAIILVAKLFISSATLCYFFFIPLVILLHLLDYSKSVHSCLVFIGKKSTLIWFSHAYFTFYIFHSYIYSLSMGWIIFLVVLLLSLISSYIFSEIYKTIAIHFKIK